MYMFRSSEMERSPADMGLPYEDIYFTAEDGITINAWFIKQRNIADCPTILYFHGNAGNISDRLMNLGGMFEHLGGVNILIVDYRGYGRSENVAPNEEGLLLDAQASLDYLRYRRDVDSSRIFLFGRSLGGAVVAALAIGNESKIRGILLENTFTNVSDVIETLVPAVLFIKGLFKNQWESLTRIRRITCPVLFIVGMKDTLVPPTHMEALHSAATRAIYTSLVKFPCGTHNDTWTEPGYYPELRRFIEKCLREYGIKETRQTNIILT